MSRKSTTFIDSYHCLLCSFGKAHLPAFLATAGNTHISNWYWNLFIYFKFEQITFEMSNALDSFEFDISSFVPIANFYFRFGIVHFSCANKCSCFVFKDSKYLERLDGTNGNTEWYSIAK